MIGKIGVFDSGIGGVSVLKELQKEIPEGDFYYLSDDQNNPYGDKTKEEIKKIVFQNIEYLLKKECKIIVIACNTATAVAIDDLRSQYPETTFIGTEPAIKIAYDHAREKSTLLLATKLTLECERVQELIHKYELPNLFTYPCVGLAELIENRHLDEVKNYIEEHFRKYREVTTVILGCTHYPLVKNYFQDFFKHAEIIEGGKGIAKETRRKVDSLALTFSKHQVEFENTSKDPHKKEIFEIYRNEP